MLSIQSICVCGAGTMGRGIAQLSVQAGYATLLYDRDPHMLEKGEDAIKKNLQWLVEKNKTTESFNAMAARLRTTTDIRYCIADLFIEAIVEMLEAKSALFRQLQDINHAGTVFASNTSSLSVSAIAAGIAYPQRVAGMHFFNPAPVMQLVEVVRAAHTSDATMQTLVALARQMGKIPVCCNDAPGFIVNHVARPYYLEALRLLESGIPAATIDAIMEASGFKMGPFRLMDLIGNDINYAVSQYVYTALGSPGRLKPSPLQKKKVEENELGRKTGKGYYIYT